VVAEPKGLMSKFRGYLLPIISGILLSVSFPLADIQVAAWFALVPLLLSLKDGSAGSFYKGFITGLVFYISSIYWIVNAMFYYGGLNIAVSIILMAALSAYLAVYIGLFAALSAYIRKKSPTVFILAAPAIWVSLELVRNYFISGFPWDQLGYSQHASLHIIQMADITGVYGVSALIVLVNAAMAEYISDTGARSFGRALKPVAAFAAVALIFGYGQYRLSHPPHENGRLKVALIQGNIEQFHKWDAQYQKDIFETYTKMTFEAAKTKPDIVVWPETATPFYFQDKYYHYRLLDVAKASGTFLLTGSPSVEELGNNNYLEHNSAYLISPDGEVAGRYDKMHLVPFGEYIPLKKLLPFVSKMVSGIGDFGAGTSYTLLDAKKASIGTAICFEAIFPELVRQFALGGADCLATVTNDAWYGKTAAPYQHFNMAIFRAVENRRSMLRVANTGITGIILPSGEVVSRTGLFTRETLSGEVPLVSELTFYTRYGDIFAYACILISALILISAVLKKRSNV